MADTDNRFVKATRHIVDKIREDFFNEEKRKSPYTFVGKLGVRAVSESEIIWVRRNSTGGLIPIVADGVNSPIGTQGDYREFKAKAIEMREALLFTREELEKIISADKNIRVSAKAHLDFELKDQLRRARDMRELVAHNILYRGALRYSSMLQDRAIQVNVTFPVKLRTESASWALAATTIVTNMQTFLDEYQDRVGRLPDFIKMTSRLFNNYVKTNTEVKAIYQSAFVFQKTAAQTRGGFLTPVDVAQANGWPPIVFSDHRYEIRTKLKSAATAGSNVRLEFKDGTFGLYVGGKVLINFRYDSNGNTTWDEEATITSVQHGKAINIDTLDSSRAIDIPIVARPFFFPENRIVFGMKDPGHMFLEPPYGIQDGGANNGPILPPWRGLRVDSFMTPGEPNLGVTRRITDKFGMEIQPDADESIRVIL